MNSSPLETFLALIYVDSAARARFQADPYAEAKRAGLSENDSNALLKIDRTSLEMAARSFSKKRHTKQVLYDPSPLAKLRRVLSWALTRII